MSDLTAHLLRRLREVQAALGLEARADGPGVHFAEALASMGLVEFVGLVADDCGVTPEAVERAAGRRFGTAACRGCWRGSSASRRSASGAGRRRRATSARRRCRSPGRRAGR